MFLWRENPGPNVNRCTRRSPYRKFSYSVRCSGQDYTIMSCFQDRTIIKANFPVLIEEIERARKLAIFLHHIQ